MPLLQAAVRTQGYDLTPLERAGIPALLHFWRSASATTADNDDDDVATHGSDLEPLFAAVEELLERDVDVTAVLSPPFARPVPHLYAATRGELCWLHVPECQHALVWDDAMCEPAERDETTRALLVHAMQAILSVAEQERAQQALACDPQLVHHIGLTPEKLPGLVEHNPLIAIDVLLQLIPSPQITDYFTALVNMDLSVHSMEVVNRLTTAVELPPEFIHLYISYAAACTCCYRPVAGSCAAR